MFGFDKYVWKSRISPAAIFIFPTFLISNMFKPEWGNFFIASGVSICLLFVIEQFVRALGKKVERRLLDEWGGYPTTKFLRHKDTPFSQKTLNGYHSKLESKTLLAAPTRAEECKDIKKADEVYDRYVAWLKSEVRGQERFYLVQEENMNYGLRRNLLGLKSIAMVYHTLLSILFIISASSIYIPLLNSLLIGFILILALIFWEFFVKSSWVEEIANIYAKQLISCLDAI